MAAPETLATRRAALLLHGLPPAARGRLLARLSAAESARLQPLLRELAELGVSPPLSRLLQQQAPLAPAAPDSTAVNARQRAAQLNAPDVAQVLKLCSPATMATLLGVADWPWKDEVLERAGELRRAELQRYQRGDAPAASPAVTEALCERLCREVDANRTVPWTR